MDFEDKARRAVAFLFLLISAGCLLYSFREITPRPVLHLRTFIRYTTGSERREPVPDERHDKWIVVTTIQDPTPAIRRLCADPTWRTVVVADLQTPPTWRVEGCDFLSVQQQERHGWRTAEHIPYRSYARKTLGYLYAIERGATIIYETDDDNQLIVDEIPVRPDPIELNVVHHIDTGRVVNAYAHFGQPSLWPRGYPLGRIGDSARQLTLRLEPQVRPLVQQWLANGDPDVDALFRLTRKTNGQRLDLRFDPHAPDIALPRGTYCPFNSQNTVHLADAFFTMWIPVTTTFRVCDIWRGYIAQRLLWEVDGSLMFGHPTVHQERNEHRNTADFVDEKQLYEDTPRLLAVLDSYTCHPDTDLLDCYAEILGELVDANLLGAEDYYLAQAWWNDLLDAGYRMPPGRVWPAAPNTTTVRSFTSDRLPTYVHGIGTVN